MRSAQDEDASVRLITNIVLRDYSLTLRLLRTANSPAYNRSGRPIHSVTHANERSLTQRDAAPPIPSSSSTT